jgi:hypothetical protein
MGVSVLVGAGVGVAVAVRDGTAVGVGGEDGVGEGVTVAVTVNVNDAWAVHVGTSDEVTEAEETTGPSVAVGTSATGINVKLGSLVHPDMRARRKSNQSRPCRTDEQPLNRQ